MSAAGASGVIGAATVSSAAVAVDSEVSVAPRGDVVIHAPDVFVHLVKIFNLAFLPVVNQSVGLCDDVLDTISLSANAIDLLSLIVVLTRLVCKDSAVVCDLLICSRRRVLVLGLTLLKNDV